MAAEKKPNFFVRAGHAIAKFFRDYGSEMKKITWSPKDDVRKNTIIVVLIAVAFTIGIGVVDLLFSQGIIALGNLF